MMLVAHRAGNTLDGVRAAQHLVDAIEVDLHRGRGGRTEVRHAKRLWPTQRLWERWYLLPSNTATPTLDQILDAIDDDVAVWFDLKGVRQSVSETIEALARRDRSVMVSSKSWWLLYPFTGRENVRTFRSVGNRLELILLLLTPQRARVDGTVIHRRLLTPSLVTKLRRRGPIFTWGVTDRASIEWLEARGIAGVIIDDLDLARS